MIPYAICVKVVLEGWAVTAITGGFYYDGYSGWPVLDSTEILQEGEWVQGKINDTICYLLGIFWCPKIQIQNIS